MPTAPCAGADRGARRGQSRARPRERLGHGERGLLFQRAPRHTWSTCAAGQGGRRGLGVDCVRGSLPWSCAQAGPRAGPSVTFLPHGGAHHTQGHGKVQAHRRPGHGWDCFTPGPAGPRLARRGVPGPERVRTRPGTPCDCSATRRAWLADTQHGPWWRIPPLPRGPQRKSSVSSPAAAPATGCVANFAQEVSKGQLPLAVGGIRRPVSRTVRPPCGPRLPLRPPSVVS